MDSKNKLKNSAFNTKGFIRSFKKLRKNEKLREFYPSEAWSIYRILPECSSVLDIGCGSGNVSRLLNMIVKGLSYCGVDSSKKIISLAKKFNEEKRVKFIHSDAIKYLEKIDSEFDCVMSFAAMYAFPEFYKVIELMLKATKRYVIFDMRFHERDTDIADIKLSCTVHDNVKSPYVIISFRKFLRFLLSRKDSIARLEVSGYDFPVNRNTHYINPKLTEPALASVVIEKKFPGSPYEKLDWYIKVPPRLEKIVKEEFK